MKREENEIVIKEAKVLRNTQIVDRFAPHVFMSTVRHDKTRELLDIAIGCMEPERDYIFNLHQDEQVDDSRVIITSTVSFKPIVQCRDCKLCDEEHYGAWGRVWHCEKCGDVDPNGFCAWGERKMK